MGFDSLFWLHGMQTVGMFEKFLVDLDDEVKHAKLGTVDLVSVSERITGIFRCFSAVVLSVRPQIAFHGASLAWVNPCLSRVIANVDLLLKVELPLHKWQIYAANVVVSLFAAALLTQPIVNLAFRLISSALSKSHMHLDQVNGLLNVEKVCLDAA